MLYTIQNSQGQTAKIYSYGVYRPDRNNVDLQEEILPNSDIVIFDHGLHWRPFQQASFQGEMASYLGGFRDSNLTLLAWRETSAQHVDGFGGHYRTAKEKKSKICQPITSGKEGYRKPLMQQAAMEAGLKWKNLFDESFVNEPAERDELVFLPFRNYTVPLHWLHPGECTHYCHSPYLWLPLWRNLRIALDRALRIDRRLTTVN